MPPIGLRVLLLTPFYAPNVGGVETHLLDLVEYLRSRGDEVTVLTYAPLVTRTSAPRHESDRGLEVRRLPWPRGLFGLLEPVFPLEFAYLFPGLAAAGARVARRNRYDVVHGHGLTGGAAAGLVGRLAGVRSVVSLHTTYRLANRPLLARAVRAMLRPAAVVLANSEAGARDLHAAGLERRRVGTFSYWLDPDVFQPRDRREARARLGGGDRFVYLFVHRLTEQKGVPLVLEAAARLADSGRFTFVFAGDGPLAEQVREAERRVPGVRYVGALAKEDLAWLYSAGDLMHGNPDLDYMGRASMEAMLCGCPVLAPDRVAVMGVEAPVDRARFPGIRFVAPEPGALAGALRELERDGEALAGLRRGAAAYMQGRADPRNAEAVRAAYVNGRGPAP